MAHPIVLTGGAAVSAGAGWLARGGTNFVRSLANRLGTAANPKVMLETAKKHPLMFTLAAKETAESLGLIDITDEAARLEAKAKAEAAKQEAQAVSLETAEVSQGFSQALDALQDDFKVIASAASAIGGISQLVALRHALNMPEATIKAYNKYRMSRI